MLPDFVRDYIKPILQIVIGIYLTRLAFRAVPAAGERSRYGRGILKVAGPIVLLVGVISLLTGGPRSANRSASGTPADWQRIETADGVFSAEFPGAPSRDVIPVSGIDTRRNVLERPGGDYYFSLTDFDLPPDAPAMTADEWMDAFRDQIPELGRAVGIRYEFARERPITTDGVPGREVEFDTLQDHWLRLKMYILGRRVYRLNVVTPKGRKDDEEPRRVLESVRFRMPRE
jgi:hypothetical protein